MVRFIRIVVLVVSFIGCSFVATAQDASKGGEPWSANVKIKRWYVYWGWNHSAYTDSDIKFSGSDYDFTLYDVNATDRPTWPFSLKTHLHPGRLTIPQYNARLGYKLGYSYKKGAWDLSIGVDHMKYVAQQYQTVPIDGYIKRDNKFKGVYQNEKDAIKLNGDFLRFEHSDGLNYINLSLRHSKGFYLPFYQPSFVGFEFVKGIETGPVIPRTMTILFDWPSHDEFHLSGVALNGMAAVKTIWWNRLIVQFEGKLGYVAMPWVKTNYGKEDKASHNFYFAQWNVVFGAQF